MQHCGAHLDYTVVPMSLLIVLAINNLKYQHFSHLTPKIPNGTYASGFHFYQDFPTYDHHNISVSVTAHYTGVSWAGMKWGAILTRLQKGYKMRTKKLSSSLSTSQFTDGNIGNANIWLWEQQNPVKSNSNFNVGCASYCIISFSSKSTIL